MHQSSGRDYQIHEFAKLTGLTVRALQHYDHLGLLTPRRSRAGHRTYSDHDLQALAHILALKSVGVPLRQIATLGQAGGPGLGRALTMQRVALEKRRPLLDRAITAIQNVELSLERGQQADPQALKHLIEVVGPQEEAAVRVASPATSRPHRAPMPVVPDRAEMRRRWTELLAAVEAAVDGDPLSLEGQALAGRWVDLMQLLTGDAASLYIHLTKSSEMLELSGGQGAELRDGSTPQARIWEFIGRALAARAKGTSAPSAAC